MNVHIHGVGVLGRLRESQSLIDKYRCPPLEFYLSVVRWQMWINPDRYHKSSKVSYSTSTVKMIKNIPCKQEGDGNYSN